MRRRSIALWLGLAALLCAPALARGEDAPPHPEQAGLDKMIAELRVEAARIRGLEWKHAVPGHIIAPKDIPAAFEEELDALLSKPDRELYVKVSRRLGMLREDQDIWELQKQMMAGLAGGFYSPRAKQLYVVEGFSGDAARPIILHELVHALEDQYYDFLGTSLPLMADTDKTFANGCIVEGSAEYARVAYMKDHKDIAALYLQASRDPVQGRRQMEVMLSVPAWLILPMLMQYQTGPAFLGKGLEKAKAGGPSPNPYKTVVAHLWADAPVSQEQVIHPERFFGEQQDYPRGVVWAADLGEALGRGWEVVHEQRMGELDLALYLDYFLGGNRGLLNPVTMLHAVPACEVARRAAGGWDAGEVAFLEKSGEPMAVVQAWSFDSTKDADEAAAALADTLQKSHGDAWEAQAWQAVAAGLGEPFFARTLTYRGKHGWGRLLHRDDHVLIVDGVPEERLEALWRWVKKTRFMKDDRDTWSTGRISDTK